MCKGIFCCKYYCLVICNIFAFFANKILMSFALWSMTIARTRVSVEFQNRNNL